MVYCAPSEMFEPMQLTKIEFQILFSAALRSGAPQNTLPRPRLYRSPTYSDEAILPKISLLVLGAHDRAIKIIQLAYHSKDTKLLRIMTGSNY